MSTVQASDNSSFLVVTGDLKLEGPVTNQVKMLLEENAALQVDISLNAVSDMLIILSSTTPPNTFFITARQAAKTA